MRLSSRPSGGFFVPVTTPEAQPTGGPFVFGGFASPHYTQVPDDFFDVLMAELTPPEFKVCAYYIVRRTFGWKKEADTISLAQMVHGIRRRDGSHVDRGTGLSKPTVVAAIKGLLAKGVIVRELNSSPDKGNEATTYALRLAGDMLDPSAEALTGPVNEVNQGPKGPVSADFTPPVNELNQGEQAPVSSRLTGLVKPLDPHHDSLQQPTGQQPATQEQTIQETAAAATANAGSPGAIAASVEVAAGEGSGLPLVDVGGRTIRYRPPPAISRSGMNPQQVWQTALAELGRTMTPATFET